MQKFEYLVFEFEYGGGVLFKLDLRIPGGTKGILFRIRIVL
jgi:hypothetical protein